MRFSFRGNQMQEKTKGYIVILLSGILWGFNGVFVTSLVNLGATTVQISMMRQSISCVLLFLFILIKDGIKVFKVGLDSVFVLVLTGLFSEALCNLVYSESIRRVGMGVAGVLMYTAPVFVLFLSAIFFKEKITFIKILAVIINLAGCALTATGGRLDAESLEIIGVLLGVASGLCYGLVTIFGKFVAGKVPPMVITFYLFLFGTICLIPMGKIWEIPFSAYTPKMLLVGVGESIFSTITPYILFQIGLAKPIEASKAPVLSSDEPVIACILGALLFNESFGWVKILGILMVIASIVIINSKDKHSNEVQDV